MECNMFGRLVNACHSKDNKFKIGMNNNIKQQI